MNIAAGFAAAFAAITGTVLTRYGQTLHLPPFAFGMLAALPFLTALIQIPASLALERFGGRRKIAIFATMLQRVLWLAIAAVPWIFPHAWWWLGLLIFLGLANLAGHAGVPALISWTADLVPSRLRGRYFALRGQIARIITVPICLLLGWLLDKAQGMDILQQTISMLLVLASLLGITDNLLYLKLPDPWQRPRSSALRFFDIIKKPLQDRHFRFFLAYSGFMTLATAFIGPFVWLYLTEVVKETNSEAIFMTMIGTSLVSLLGMHFWGKVIDHWGSRRVMLIAGLFIINGATSWLFVTPTSKWSGYLVAIISAFAWPAMELAVNNLLFSMSETGRGLTSRLGSAYVALTSTVIAISGTISGLFGGWVGQQFQHWHGTMFGFPLTYHSILFTLSAILRIVALLFVFGFKDDRSSSYLPRLRFTLSRIKTTTK